MFLVGVTALAAAACKDFLNPFKNACTPATAVSLFPQFDSLVVGERDSLFASATSDPNGLLPFPLCPFSWRTSDSRIVTLNATTGAVVVGLAKSPGSVTVTVTNAGKNDQVSLVVK